MVAAVQQLSARDNLALDETGKGLTNERGIAQLRTKVEGGNTIGLLIGVGIAG